MTFSSAGLIGGAIGLAIAIATYLAVTSALKRRTQDSAQSAEQREQGASTIRSILLADIPILTAIGYFLGQALE
jgi:hypothetical protein